MCYHGIGTVQGVRRLHDIVHDSTAECPYDFSPIFSTCPHILVGQARISESEVFEVDISRRSQSQTPA